jgi:hypothetical protein
MSAVFDSVEVKNKDHIIISLDGYQELKAYLKQLDEQFDQM